jgi:hypothetical protein
MIFELIVILLFHWIGDFVLQTRYIAENKSNSFLVLFFHVGIYTAVISSPLILLSPFVHQNHYIIWIVLNAGLHFTTDAFASKIATKYYQQENMKAFFNVMGLEQFIHTCFLILTTAWLI